MSWGNRSAVGGACRALSTITGVRCAHCGWRRWPSRMQHAQECGRIPRGWEGRLSLQWHSPAPFGSKRGQVLRQDRMPSSPKIAEPLPRWSEDAGERTVSSGPRVPA